METILEWGSNLPQLDIVALPKLCQIPGLSFPWSTGHIGDFITVGKAFLPGLENLSWEKDNLEYRHFLKIVDYCLEQIRMGKTFPQIVEEEEKKIWEREGRI